MASSKLDFDWPTHSGSPTQEVCTLVRLAFKETKRQTTKLVGSTYITICTSTRVFVCFFISFSIPSFPYSFLYYFIPFFIYFLLSFFMSFFFYFCLFICSFFFLFVLSFFLFFFLFCHYFFLCFSVYFTSLLQRPMNTKPDSPTCTLRAAGDWRLFYFMDVTFLGVPLPFFPGIRVFSGNHFKNPGETDPVLKRSMVEKNANGIKPHNNERTPSKSFYVDSLQGL